MLRGGTMMMLVSDGEVGASRKKAEKKTEEDVNPEKGQKFYGKGWFFLCTSKGSSPIMCTVFLMFDAFRLDVKLKLESQL